MSWLRNIVIKSVYYELVEGISFYQFPFTKMSCYATQIFLNKLSKLSIRIRRIGLSKYLSKLNQLYWNAQKTFFSNSLEHKECNINKLNCCNKCIIYFFTCNKCRKQYLGETLDSVSQPWNNYENIKRVMVVKCSVNRSIYFLAVVYFLRYLNFSKSSCVADKEILKILLNLFAVVISCRKTVMFSVFCNIS